MLNFEVPRKSIKLLSQAFRLLEANKSRLSIDDYVLSQSTLEQVSVFICVSMSGEVGLICAMGCV